MKSKIFILTIIIAIIYSCEDDLNTIPLDDDVVTSATVYENTDSYRQVLAKVYAALSVSGQEGPYGNPDISGIGEDFASYLRQYWNAQELTTDEMVLGWGDGTLPDYHDQDWTSTGEWITAMYNRIYYSIALCNELIRETTDQKLEGRGVSGDLLEEVKVYRAEARFMRALAYWNAIDMFGNVPFVTEEDGVGSFFPKQGSRKEVFEFIESELKDIENVMISPRQNEYGRADRAAAWFLLAKLYLNAEVYIGESKYTECVEYSEKVNTSAYTLEEVYEHLFLADNNKTSEIILPITFDGLSTKTWGSMTYIIHAGVGGTVDMDDIGINGPWSGFRTTKNLVEKFDDITGETDSRAMFHTDGQSLEIDNLWDYNQGYIVLKYKNITSTGETGSDLTFPDTDFPLFRLADAYLMYAEAVLRGGEGGSLTQALDYVNAVRERAYGDDSGNIAEGELTLDFLIDERARELYYECHRRTDLIRFGMFSDTDYYWPLKGGVVEGASTDSKYDLFPIPASDIVANPNLVQNPGY